MSDDSIGFVTNDYFFNGRKPVFNEKNTLYTQPISELYHDINTTSSLRIMA